MLHKDMRRADRRWRSRCVFIRRLKNDWATHGWNWNYRRIKFSRLGVAPSVACSIWADTTLCECFWNPAFNGMGRFKDTPHPRCSGYECCPERVAHGLESRSIQEWRELGRAMGDDAREYWNRTRKTPDRLMLVRQTCGCGFLMKTFLKPAGEIRWRDKRSEKYCPDCECRYGPKKKAIDVPA